MGGGLSYFSWRCRDFPDFNQDLEREAGNLITEVSVSSLSFATFFFFLRKRKNKNLESDFVKRIEIIWQEEIAEAVKISIPVAKKAFKQGTRRSRCFLIIYSPLGVHRPARPATTAIGQRCTFGSLTVQTDQTRDNCWAR